MNIRNILESLQNAGMKLAGQASTVTENKDAMTIVATSAFEKTEVAIGERDPVSKRPDARYVLTGINAQSAEYALLPNAMASHYEEQRSQQFAKYQTLQLTGTENLLSGGQSASMLQNGKGGQLQV